MGEKSQESVARLYDGREPRNALRCIGLRDRHNDFSSLREGPPVSKVLPWVYHRRNMDRNHQRCLNNCSKSFPPHTHSPVPQMSLVCVLGWLFRLIFPSFLRSVCQVLLMMGKPRSLRPSPATREPRLPLHPPWNGGPFSPSLCRERDWPGLFFWGSLLVEEGGTSLY